jgi:hypothetical protein
MANKEMWDYFSGTETADYTAANLTLKARGAAREICVKNQEVYLMDDNSEKRVSYSDDSICYLEIPYNVMNESDSGIIFDYWNDSAKGNGIARSFYYEHGDGHTYTVRFDKSMEREVMLGNLYRINVRMKVLGRAP